MRPVIRGPRGPYPYNIDMTTYGNLIGSLQNYTLNYLAAGVVNLLGANPDMEDQLDYVWLMITRVDLGEVGAPGNIAARRLAKPTIVSRNGDEYRLSANQLIANMGRFCAYCEKPNPAPLPVEHMVPKDNFPLFSLSWTNFLLTCTVCNALGSGKGVLPARATVRGWPAGAPADELGYFTACQNRYLWPDDVPAYQDLVPRLEYFSHSQNAWIPVPAADSVRWGITITTMTYATRTITASLYINAGPNLRVRDVRVVYVPQNAPATRSLAYFGLDRPGGGGANPATSDGRMYDLTRAWFDIVATIGVGTVIPLGNWGNWWANIPIHAANIGHFSLWVRILDQLNTADPQNPGQTLLDRFLADCLGGNGFPGTDITQVP